jgi:hypothetical protein
VAFGPPVQLELTGTDVWQTQGGSAQSSLARR